METLITLMVLAVLYGTFLILEERAKIKQLEAQRRQREFQEKEAVRLRQLRIEKEQERQRIRKHETEQQHKLQEQQRLQAAISTLEEIRQRQSLEVVLQSVRDFMIDNGYDQVYNVIRLDSNSFPFVTFFNANNQATNIYFSSNAAKLVSDGQSIFKGFFNDFVIEITTNNRGEKYNKIIHTEEKLFQKQVTPEANTEATKALEGQGIREQEIKLQQEIAGLGVEKIEKTKRHLLQIDLYTKRKNSSEDYRRVLQENGISTLYHFTDRANIPSIKEFGALLSWWYCKQNGITILKPSSDDTSKSLDLRYNLEDYVRLSFTQNHPMMYVAKSQGRIQDPIVLKINPEICLFEETKFSDMNATKTGHNCGPALEDLMRIRFAVVKQNKHFDLSDEDKPYYQAEVLVKTALSIEWITNINDF